MILKASQRGGGMALAAHLLKSENEHVEVHEVRGFVADDLKGAMKEAQAVAKGTRCKQPLFSVSFNPPETASVSIDKFEAAIERVEQANGLTGQPRIIVFHEKEGRRHAHCVWSRIDSDTMTARPLPFFKQKLREVAKGLYLEHGWHLPRGLIDSREHDPRNFTLAEWQQAKRTGRDPKQLKAAVQECWAASDGKAAFERALGARGLYLARGDRRGHVIVTYEGETISVARITDVKTKDVVAKLGKPDTLRGVNATKAHIASNVAPRLSKLIEVINRARAREMAPLEERRLAMRDKHAAERLRLDEGQKARFTSESRQRSERLRKGVAGLWDRMTRKHRETVRLNEAQAFSAFRRDRDQRHALVVDQLEERRMLQREIITVRQRHTARVTELHRDLARQVEAREAGKDGLRKTFDRAAGHSRDQRSSPDTPPVTRTRSSDRAANREGPRGPDFGR